MPYIPLDQRIKKMTLGAEPEVIVETPVSVSQTVSIPEPVVVEETANITQTVDVHVDPTDTTTVIYTTPVPAPLPRPSYILTFSALTKQNVITRSITFDGFTLTLNPDQRDVCLNITDLTSLSVEDVTNSGSHWPAYYTVVPFN